MGYCSIVHEALRDGAAQAGIVGGDDDVALLGECEGSLPVVLKPFVVRGRALRCVASGAVCPDDDRESGIVAPGVMVGSENVCGGWKQSAVDVLADIGEARERQAGGDPERFGGSAGKLVLPLHDRANRIVVKVLGGGIERVAGDVGILPQAGVEGQGLFVARFATIVTCRREVDDSCSSCKECQLQKYQYSNHDNN